MASTSEPLEIQMMEIEGLQMMTSCNQEGVSSICWGICPSTRYGPGGSSRSRPPLSARWENSARRFVLPPSFQTMNPR